MLAGGIDGCARQGGECLNTLIENRTSKGGPLRDHWGAQRLTPTADDGTTLDCTIGFDVPVPGMATVVGKVLTGAMIVRPRVQ